MLKDAIRSEEMVEFYHVSDDVSFLKNFLDDGAKAIGRGLGGQENGFYVFTSRDWANEHVKFKSQRSGRIGARAQDQGDFSFGGGLLIGVQLQKSSIVYPDWRLDYEVVHPASLFDKYAEDILKLKDLPLGDDPSKKISIVDRHPYNKYGFWIIQTEGDKQDASPKDIYCDGNNEGAEYVAYIAAICNEMCKTNKNFLNDYNALLQKAIDIKGRVALKYTGKEPLVPSYVALLQVDTNGDFKESVLYTNQEPKEKQVCPFLIAGLKMNEK